MCWSQQLLHSLASAPVFLPTRGGAFFFARDKLATAKAEIHVQSAIGRRPCIRAHAANPKQQGSVCCSFGTLPLLNPYCHYHITSILQPSSSRKQPHSSLASVQPWSLSASYALLRPRHRSESDEHANHPGGSDPVGHFRTALAHPAAVARMSQGALARSRLAVGGCYR